MKKKIFITLGIVVLIIVAAFVYMNYQNRNLSPPGSASLTNGNLSIEVTYSRPSVRDRIIFGTVEQEALQPYGVYWRLGANESTEITFNQDVLLVDQQIEKGTYRMYTIPGENYFELRLNTELGQWGYFEPDYSLDVLKVTVPAYPNDLTEQFTIDLEPLYDSSIKMIVLFEKVRLEIPIIPQ